LEAQVAGREEAAAEESVLMLVVVLLVVLVVVRGQALLQHRVLPESPQEAGVLTTWQAAGCVQVA
jgi:hypothetical protein